MRIKTGFAFAIWLLALLGYAASEKLLPGLLAGSGQEATTTTSNNEHPEPTTVKPVRQKHTHP